MNPPNMMAAPNRSHIVAKVLRVQRSPVWRDRWQLELELSASSPLEGPQFPLLGRTLQANLVTPLDPPPVGATIEATAEYVGGPDGGVLNLTDVEASAASMRSCATPSRVTTYARTGAVGSGRSGWRARFVVKVCSVGGGRPRACLRLPNGPRAADAPRRSTCDEKGYHLGRRKRPALIEAGRTHPSMPASARAVEDIVDLWAGDTSKMEWRPLRRLNERAAE